MQVIETVEAMRQACASVRWAGTRRRKLGLVPTMGAIHEGHLSLVHAARTRCELVAVSLFVNPAQFGPGEDLDRYPRTFEQDCSLLEREGVDLLFAPSAEEMYPGGVTIGTLVEVPEIGARLDGRSRPGHFKGVATVVAKLFHIVGPELAFFGQKDAAQVAVLQAMVRDLNFPLRIVVCPTVREADGLALSSRNRFLSAGERLEALALARALRAAEELGSRPGVRAEELRAVMRSFLSGARGLRLDYAEVVRPDTLEPLAEDDDLAGGALVAVAGWVGATRLIDNAVLPARETATP